MNHGLLDIESLTTQMVLRVNYYGHRVKELRCPLYKKLEEEKMSQIKWGEPEEYEDGEMQETEG